MNENSPQPWRWPDARILAAMATPCRAPGEVDAAGVQRLGRELLRHGCDALFVCGSTGELPFLDEADRREIVRAARAACPSATPLFAGVSGTGLKQIVRYARLAAEDGADVAVVMAPFFLQLSQTQLAEYVLRIADASPIPVAAYHHRRMPTVFEVPTIARLAQHPNIVAFKESSGDEERITRITEAVKGTQLRVFQGNEPILLRSLQAGAQGFVTALANIAPEWHRNVVVAWQQGDLAEAQRWQDKLNELWKMFRFTATAESFGHFLHTLKLPLKMRGWTDSTASFVPGFASSAEFDRAIFDHIRNVGLLSETPA